MHALGADERGQKRRTGTNVAEVLSSVGHVDELGFDSVKAMSD